MTALTPAQGRFLTSLLNDLTEVAPRAGAEARTLLHATFHAGNLTKAEASRSITVLKQAIALAKGTATRPVASPVLTLAPAAPAKAPSAPLPAPLAPALSLGDSSSQQAAAARLEGAAYKARRKAAPLKGAGIVRLLGKSREESEALAAQAVREGCPF